MEPQLPSPQSNPEVGPQFNSAWAAESLPGVPSVPERDPKNSSESKEASRQNFDNSGVPLPVAAVPAKPTVPTSGGAANGRNSAITQGSPVSAADDDLIEKEWVDHTKKTVARTRHDPYMQEKAVSQLQADYLQKRYGKTIKLSGE